MSRLQRLVGTAYFYMIVWTSIRFARSVIAVSKTTQRDIFKLFRLRSVISPNIISYQPSVVAPAVQKKNYFVYIGNARKHKNLKLILDLCYQTKFLDDFKIYFIGSCCKHDDIIRLQGDFEFRVELHGAVSEEEKQTYLAEAKGLFLFSTYEGFGIPIAEALLAKTQVYCSDISVFHEFKSNGIRYYDLTDKDIVSRINNDLRKEKSITVHFSYDKFEIERQKLAVWKSLFLGNE